MGYTSITEPGWWSASRYTSPRYSVQRFFQHATHPTDLESANGGQYTGLFFHDSFGICHDVHPVIKFEASSV
ncbi:hypothetical protein [Alteromonas lipotrueiana]|uniref:hypothetical protein n=1 Tax=Alteromonas lipotrueiana TaxID=2803815 RepID=UPI001C4710DF|nr:hypothetical protein [Alteromonas lipotrueiana]